MQESQHVTHFKTLNGHTYGVAFLSWSPDDSHILACGSEEACDFWIWNTEVTFLILNFTLLLCYCLILTGIDTCFFNAVSIFVTVTQGLLPVGHRGAMEKFETTKEIITIQ